MKGTSDRSWLDRSLACFAPRERPSAAEWLERCVRLPPDGAPWAPWSYPHLHAPGGPIEAYMRPDCRAVWLQFGSRLGKTALGTALLQYQAAVDPCPMLFGSATEELACRVVKTKIYPSLEYNPELRDQLRAPGRRNATLIELRHCRIYVAWGGSSSQLADLSARVGHANEIDKWTSFANSEADPLELFRERLKEFPTRKFFGESTPALAGCSRIERGLAGSSSRRLWVACPYCHEYQTIDFGDATTPWGVKWAPGLADAEAIRASAQYVCKHCSEGIADHLRPRMMRSGVWAPEGQTPARDGSLVGTPLRSGGEEGFQLSSFYALNLGWGDMAAKFWESKDHPLLLQNWKNSWEGLTWSEHFDATTEEQLADRLCSNRAAGVVPDEAIFLTVGVDVQETHVVYVVVAWGLEARGWVVRWGFAPTLQSLDSLVLDVGYVDASKRLRHRPVVALVDSGAFTDDVYAYCRGRRGKTHPKTFPSKGADSSQQTTAYRPAKLKPDNLQLIHVHTNYFQTLLQKAFIRLRPGDPGSLELPAGARFDQDFLSQLLNEAPERDGIKRVWKKIRTHDPNDFRDALRYARCAAELYTQGAWPRLTAEHRSLSTEPVGGVVIAAPASPPPPKATTSPRQGGFTRPDGTPFLVSERGDRRR